MPVKIEGMDQLERRLDPKRFMDMVADAMDETVDFAVEVQKDAIEHSGTGRQWQGDWGSMPNGTPGRTTSDPGRVATGEMRDSVSGVVKQFPDRIVGEVGWLDGSPAHARFQELGFRHAITGDAIEGMESLREAEEQGTDELLSQLNKIAGRL